VTNYGALAIMRAIPHHGSPGSEAELRLALALETFHADDAGNRRATIRQLSERAGMTEITTRRARDRLVAAGVVIHKRGHARGTGVWRLLISLIADAQGERIGEPNADAQGERIGEPQSQSAHLGRPVSADAAEPNALTSSPQSAHPERAPYLSTTSKGGSVGAEIDRARDDDQPDYRRGPGRAISGRILRPGQRPDDRPTPTPPHWQSPRTNPPPEMAHHHATIARKLLADRPRPAGAEPARVRIKDLDEDARRAVALRQATRARAERERTGPPKPAEPEPPTLEVNDAGHPTGNVVAEPEHDREAWGDQPPPDSYADWIAEGRDDDDGDGSDEGPPDEMPF
jgi:hypothetical protein